MSPIRKRQASELERQHKGTLLSESEHDHCDENNDPPASSLSESNGNDVSHDPLLSFYREHCVYLLPMLGWFFFSGCLSLYNKFIFGQDYYHFPCPLILTSMHFACQWVFSYALTSAFPDRLGGDQVKNMPWDDFLNIAIPCGLVTAIDVGLSNLALVRITMTFYTMVKSSSPIFVVISAYIFGIEKITPALIATVLIISAGELLTVMGEVDFDLIGFFLVLAATVMAGMRWTVVQLKLQSHDPPIKSSIATMRILSPLMFLSMVMLSVIFEQPWNKLGKSSGTDYFSTFENSMHTIGLGLIGGVVAICMLLCEFYLIMQSSAIVLMIGGVLKELTTIFLGVSFLHDELNRINSFGCAVVFSGVALYKVSLQRSKAQKEYDTCDTSAYLDYLNEVDGDSGDDNYQMNTNMNALEIENIAPLENVLSDQFRYSDDGSNNSDDDEIALRSNNSFGSSGTLSKDRRTKKNRNPKSKSSSKTRRMHDTNGNGAPTTPDSTELQII